MIESSGNDIRQVINNLQMWNQPGDSKLTNNIAAQKDDKVMINNFEAAHRILNYDILSAKYKTFRDKIDLFFVDYEWVPLLV